MRRPSIFWIAIGILAVGLILLMASHDAGSILGLANERFAGLVSAAALLVVLSAGLIRSRRGVSEIVRNIGIWLLVLLLLMIGYLYRYELQDVAHRVTAGLLPGSPLSVTDGEGNVTVTVEKAPNGHFEVQTEIDGAPLRLMVDTGATSTVLTSADALAAGIDVDALRFTVPVSTANGMAMTARTRAASLRVGRIERRNVPLLVARDGALGQSLLGMNFMGTLSGYDVRGDRLILRD